MDIDVITQYILSIVPAFTAVVGMIVTLGVGIGTIKKANSQTIDKVEKSNKKIENENKELRLALAEAHKDNANLKKEMNKINAKLSKIHMKDDKEV